MDKIQRELLDYCNLIQPPYFPVLSIEKVEGKNLIVLWAPGGQNRPYIAPKEVTAKHRVHLSLLSWLPCPEKEVPIIRPARRRRTTWPACFGKANRYHGCAILHRVRSA